MMITLHHSLFYCIYVFFALFFRTFDSRWQSPEVMWFFDALKSQRFTVVLSTQAAPEQYHVHPRGEGHIWHRLDTWTERSGLWFVLWPEVRAAAPQRMCSVILFIWAVIESTLDTWSVSPEALNTFSAERMYTCI